jgi:hypothetical protein
MAWKREKVKVSVKLNTINLIENAFWRAKS